MRSATAKGSAPGRRMITTACFAPSGGEGLRQKAAVPVVTQLNPLAMDTKMPRRHMANRSNLSPCRFDKLGLTPAPKRESRASYQESLRTRPEQLVRYEDQMLENRGPSDQRRRLEGSPQVEMCRSQH